MRRRLGLSGTTEDLVDERTRDDQAAVLPRHRVNTGSLAGLGSTWRGAGRHAPAEDPGGAPRICPYRAAGCSQIVSVHDGQIVNIEGNSGSPINRGTRCGNGSARYQLLVYPSRLDKVKYAQAHATEWDDVTLDWAMDRIATLVQQTRDATFTETWEQDGAAKWSRIRSALPTWRLSGSLRGIRRVVFLTEEMAEMWQRSPGKPAKTW